ncbi:MAG: terpene cyclase/mutase family protein [Thermoguttaceae bacterium]|nr:terpene cyclase/mutase family protein [Thermoguttaceae bacterium]
MQKDDERLLFDGLDKLSKRQNSDGSFGSATELFGGDPAVAALCGLAFLGSGSAPGRGRYAVEISRIIDFILSCSIKSLAKTSEPYAPPHTSSALKAYLTRNHITLSEISGLIANVQTRGEKTLYGHGYSILFLSEAYSAFPREDIFTTIKNAVELIIRTQNTAGGWRYLPQPALLADISVSTCMLSALRAAANVGVSIPSEVISRAQDYILTLQNDDGGFRYTAQQGASGYSRTAAAIHALQVTGLLHSPELERALDYLERQILSKEDASLPINQPSYWAYGQFYTALVLWRLKTDRQRQNIWNVFFERYKREVIERRSSSTGLWESSASKEAESALILCAFEIPLERTPFFLAPT